MLLTSSLLYPEEKENDFYPTFRLKQITRRRVNFGPCATLSCPRDALTKGLCECCYKNERNRRKRASQRKPKKSSLLKRQTYKKPNPVKRVKNKMDWLQIPERSLPLE